MRFTEAFARKRKAQRTLFIGKRRQHKMLSAIRLGVLMAFGLLALHFYIR